MKRKSNLIIDFALNIIAAMLPIIFLQIIAYPYMAKMLSREMYGVALTLIGIANVVMQVSGTGINNARILNEAEYKQKKLTGDYNIIVIGIAIINIVVMIVILKLINQSISSLTFIMLLLFVELGMLKSYLTAEYNIKINFKKVLQSNIFLVIGYGVGILAFGITKEWSYIFFIGMLSTVAFQFGTTSLLSEGFGKTILFKKTLSSILTISFSSLMISLVTYADRLLLYPLMGASQVAIYYTAAIFGKLIGMGLGPVSSVLLSYFSKETRMDNKRFWKMNCINFLLCGLFYIITLFLAEPITGMLYPTIIEGAKPYIHIANLAAVITASTSLVQPTILKFCKLKWQIYIQLFHIITYITLSLVMVQLYGMIGFAYASVFVAVLKLSLICTIGTYTFSSKRDIKKEFG